MGVEINAASIQSTLNRGIYNYEISEVNLFRQKAKETVFEIVSPLLDDVRDCIEIYLIVEQDGKLSLTDDSHVYSELFLSDKEMPTALFREQVLMGMGCYNLIPDVDEDKRISISTDENMVGYHIEQFCTAISALCNLFANGFVLSKRSILC